MNTREIDVSRYAKYECLKVDVADKVATVTLNRPQARNAINQKLIRELRTMWDDLGDDHGVNVVVLTGAGDNTGLLWTLRPAPQGAESAQHARALWADLASADAKAAYRAVWAIADRPAESVPFLKERLIPAEPVEADRLRQWFADLDSDAFAVREAASRELAQVAERIEGALRRALADTGSAKVVDAAKDAQVILDIVSVVDDKEVLSLSQSGAVREYELVKRVSFRVHDNDGIDWLPPGEISLRRSYSFNETEALAREAQEQRLLREMQQDVVQQLVRRLQAAHKP